MPPLAPLRAIRHESRDQGKRPARRPAASREGPFGRSARGTSVIFARDAPDPPSNRRRRAPASRPEATRALRGGERACAGSGTTAETQLHGRDFEVCDLPAWRNRPHASRRRHFAWSGNSLTPSRSFALEREPSPTRAGLLASVQKSPTPPFARSPRPQPGIRELGKRPPKVANGPPQGPFRPETRGTSVIFVPGTPIQAKSETPSHASCQQAALHLASCCGK